MNVENNFNPSINQNKKPDTKPKFKLENIVSKAYLTIRQNVPLEGDFEDIGIDFDINSDKYRIYATTYYNSDDNKFHNSLKLTYTNDDMQTIISCTLKRGSKQDILDYLGNEKNINSINSYMLDLKEEAKRKS